MDEVAVGLATCGGAFNVDFVCDLLLTDSFMCSVTLNIIIWARSKVSVQSSWTTLSRPFTRPVSIISVFYWTANARHSDICPAKVMMTMQVFVQKQLTSERMME